MSVCTGVTYSCACSDGGVYVVEVKVRVRRCYLQLVSVVEVHADGGHHPGVEEGGQDLLGDGVSDEMKVKWVSPVENTHTRE